ALRRLDASPIALLLARRLVEGAHQSELEEALPPDRVRRLIVGPLSVGALHRFLRDRLQRSFPRQTLLRIHERSGGNPFFALELARILEAEVTRFSRFRCRTPLKSSCAQGSPNSLRPRARRL